MRRFFIGTYSADEDLNTSIENGWTVEAEDHAAAARAFAYEHGEWSGCCIMVQEVDDDCEYIGGVSTF